MTSRILQIPQFFPLFARPLTLLAVPLCVICPHPAHILLPLRDVLQSIFDVQCGRILSVSELLLPEAPSLTHPSRAWLQGFPA